MSPSRRSLLAGLAAGGAAAVASSTLPAKAAGRKAAKGLPKRPNVLFISIDDLNDWVGILGGHPQARTPNINRLASMGVSFENAHAPAPACNPSRTSVLTGRLPSSTGVYSNKAPFRHVLPDVLTLPQRFGQAGYRTMGAGKMFHKGDRASWERYWPDACAWPVKAKKGETPEGRRSERGGAGTELGWGPGRRDGERVYPDARVARIVSRELRKPQDRPFFLACGFFRPHLNWFVPQSFYDRYPLDGIELPEVKKGDLSDLPAAGRRFARLELHEKIVQTGQWKGAVQAYLASLSFADAQLGHVLDALAEGPNKSDTIVVLWSDHGWSLGTKFHWKKHALWEECTRVPLVIRVPGAQSKGGVCGRSVSLVNLFPTLLELCGLEADPEAEGHSLARLVADPKAAWGHVALTTNDRGNHAVRDERYRYIRYADGSEELYDHTTDPHEWTNLAGGSDEVKARLRAHLPKRDAQDAPEVAHPCWGFDE